MNTPVIGRDRLVELPWEESAAYVENIKGWACKVCGCFYGDGPAGERAARYCHAKDKPCDCGGRHSKHYTYCDRCRAATRHEVWLKMQEVEWDGTTPLVDHDSDRYFFSPEDLADWLLELDFDYFGKQDNPGANAGETPTDEQIMAVALENVRLCLCREVPPPTFDLVDFLCDHDDEAELDAEGLAVEKAVNDWVRKYREIYTEDNKRPSLESIKRCLGISA